MAHDGLHLDIYVAKEMRKLVNKQMKAIDAVIELHRPYHFNCSHCINIEGGYMPYPCPTIQAIEKELE